MLSNIADKLRLFIERFGEKGLLVIKAAYEVYQDPNVDHRLGDFSFKHIVLRLNNVGLNYNPANILRILEKEYGILEKSYSSSNQTWWKFIDPETIRSILSEHYGTPLDDPRIKALLIKYRSMEPRTTLETLRRLAIKEALSSGDKEMFKRFVFNELDKIVDLEMEMEKYEETFSGELYVLREVLSLAEMISSKLEKTRFKISMKEEEVRLNANTRTDIIKNTPCTKGNNSP
ncbi:MAG: hypothetical protein QXW94_01780 [Desulfurococcaceae archaeon]